MIACQYTPSIMWVDGEKPECCLVGASWQPLRQDVSRVYLTFDVLIGDGGLFSDTMESDVDMLAPLL